MAVEGGRLPASVIPLVRCGLNRQNPIQIRIVYVSTSMADVAAPRAHIKSQDPVALEKRLKRL
jgi:hypothetical protein